MKYLDEGFQLKIDVSVAVPVLPQASPLTLLS